MKAFLLAPLFVIQSVASFAMATVAPVPSGAAVECSTTTEADGSVFQICATSYCNATSASMDVNNAVVHYSYMFEICHGLEVGSDSTTFSESKTYIGVEILSKAQDTCTVSVILPHGTKVDCASCIPCGDEAFTVDCTNIEPIGRYVTCESASSGSVLFPFNALALQLDRTVEVPDDDAIQNPTSSSSTLTPTQAKIPYAATAPATELAPTYAPIIRASTKAPAPPTDPTTIFSPKAPSVEMVPTCSPIEVDAIPTHSTPFGSPFRFIMPSESPVAPTPTSPHGFPTVVCPGCPTVPTWTSPVIRPQTAPVDESFPAIPPTWYAAPLPMLPPQIAPAIEQEECPGCPTTEPSVAPPLPTAMTTPMIETLQSNSPAPSPSPSPLPGTSRCYDSNLECSPALTEENASPPADEVPVVAPNLATPLLTEENAAPSTGKVPLATPNLAPPVLSPHSPLQRGPNCPPTLAPNSNFPAVQQPFSGLMDGWTITITTTKENVSGGSAGNEPSIGLIKGSDKPHVDIGTIRSKKSGSKGKKAASNSLDIIEVSGTTSRWNTALSMAFSLLFSVALN